MVHLVRADKLQEGDWLDLEGDIYGGQDPDLNSILEFEYSPVHSTVRETPGCIVVYSEHSAFGCPPNHMLKVER